MAAAKDMPVLDPTSPQFSHPEPEPISARLDLRFVLLLACFFLSGLAGLIYQTAWTQQFALVFGTSELALVTVLAGYMAGLALGAAVAGRLAHRIERPLLVYAILELGIGVTALLVPVMIGLANRLQVVLLGGHELPTSAGSVASGVFYLFSSFAILLVPTALMGATLPLLARFAVRRTEEIGPRVGVLYTANTAGAAAGTLLAAYALLPRMGLGYTILIAAGLNILVFALAALLARGHTTEPAEKPTTKTAQGRGVPWILPLILLSGAVSFTWEILWTRLLSFLLGGSVYAFATMLATFLVGLSLGSAVASRLASSRKRAEAWFAAAQIGIAGLSLAAFSLVDRLPGFVKSLASDNGGFLAWDAVLCGAVLLPGAIAIGATFPLAVRILARDAEDAAEASARVFAWNTVGTITGALAAGYLVLPALRFAGAASAAAALSLALAATAALLARPRRRALAAAAIAGLVAVAVVRPATPWRMLRHSPISSAEMQGDAVFYAFGRSATVLLLEIPSGWRLTTNGLPESSIDANWGRPGRYVVARWLSLLALASRPETRSLLVVGLGAGVTVEEVPPSVEEIHVVELEPEVVRANRLLADRRRSDPLADPRLSLHIGDARGALRLTEREFDAIVSQPSHPWTSGASHLFTREFFTQVREHLTPGGVFVQWMGLPFVDEQLLRSFVATATEVFDHVELYQPLGGGLLVLASGQPLELAATAAETIAIAPIELMRIGIRHPEDLLAARVLDAEGARRLAQTAAAGPSTDSRNLFRMGSPRVLSNPLGAAGAERVLAPYEWIPDDLGADEALGYVRRIIRQGNPHRARRVAEAQNDTVARQTALAWVEISAGRRQPAERALRQALQLDSRSEATLAALLLIYQPAIERGEPFPFAARVQNDPAAAVASGWRLVAAGDWTGLRRLDARLAAIDSRHPLWEAATRLRVHWRADAGDVGLAYEALELVNPLLAPVASPRDVLLRARAAAAAGEMRSALEALNEAVSYGGRRRNPAVVGQARRILASLPPDEDTEDWRRLLTERLDRPPPQ